MREQMVRLNETAQCTLGGAADGYGLRTEAPWWNTRLEEDRVDGAEKGASSAIAGGRRQSYVRRGWQWESLWAPAGGSASNNQRWRRNVG
jgi:hypothetical protein